MQKVWLVPVVKQSLVSFIGKVLKKSSQVIPFFLMRTRFGFEASIKTSSDRLWYIEAVKILKVPLVKIAKEALISTFFLSSSWAGGVGAAFIVASLLGFEEEITKNPPTAKITNTPNINIGFMEQLYQMKHAPLVTCPEPVEGENTRTYFFSEERIVGGSVL